MSVYDDSLGVLLIGTVALSACWGIASILVLSYFRDVSGDEWPLRFVIPLSWVFMTTKLGFFGLAAYQNMVTHRKDSFAQLFVTHTEWPLLTAASLSIVTSVLNRILLIRRLYSLSNGKNVGLIGIMIALATVVDGSKIPILVSMIQQRSLLTLSVPDYAWIALFIATVAMDFLDGVATWHYFYRSGLSNTERMNTVLKTICLFVVGSAITLALYLGICLILAAFMQVRTFLACMVLTIASCIDFVGYMLLLNHRPFFKASLEQSLQISDVIFRHPNVTSSRGVGECERVASTQANVSVTLNAVTSLSDGHFRRDAQQVGNADDSV
ncbi:hypothetical protein BD311DRAFT_771906 [Dichomitus squalens]|uniref:Uncharacterized protein n=1 Tax=Dichomitus squalens TaxID=114155 RepID=A0A4Q9M471_9APHY|nr:hypothetical protein BD311DRAFT_771906 [Dichomitus squalens]